MKHIKASCFITSSTSSKSLVGVSSSALEEDRLLCLQGWQWENASFTAVQKNLHFFEGFGEFSGHKIAISTILSFSDEVVELHTQMCIYK